MSADPVSEHNSELNITDKQCDNPSTNFSDLIVVSELQHLVAESNSDWNISEAVDFDVKNPFFLSGSV